MDADKPDDWQEQFERIWAYREATLYPTFFGPLLPTIAPLSDGIFSGTFGQETYDFRWTFCGVMIAPPTETRRSWLYVSSGLSNAWDDEVFTPEGSSGLGCELVFETTERADWAVRLVQYMMVNRILLRSGGFGPNPPMEYNHWIPLGASIKPGIDSQLRYLTTFRHEGYLVPIKLESGTAYFLALVGISKTEENYGRRHGAKKLLALLKQANAFPVTDPERQSVVPD